VANGVNHVVRRVQAHVHSFPRPRGLSLFFPFLVFDFLSRDGAGSVGLPEPRASFISFSVTAALA
jgi:hypothetical protein